VLARVSLCVQGYYQKYTGDSNVALSSHYIMWRNTSSFAGTGDIPYMRYVHKFRRR
jgi:hypothetical protein